MRVGIVGLGFRLGYLGYVFDAIDPGFEIAGHVDPASPNTASPPAAATPRRRSWSRRSGSIC